MEKVTLKISQGVLSVEEIRIDSDRENVYVMFAVLGASGEWELSVGSAETAYKDRVYVSVTDQYTQQAVIAEAIPVLLNALEIKMVKPEDADELTAYTNAHSKLSEMFAR